MYVGRKPRNHNKAGADRSVITIILQCIKSHPRNLTWTLNTDYLLPSQRKTNTFMAVSVSDMKGGKANT